MPDLNTLEPWFKFFSNYGIGAVILLFVGAALRQCILWIGKQFDTYVPPAITAHINMMGTLTETQKQLSENQKQLTISTEKLTDSFVSHQSATGHCKATTNALLGLCDTFEHASQGHPKEPQIKNSLSSVRTILTASK